MWFHTFPSVSQVLFRYPLHSAGGNPEGQGAARAERQRELQHIRERLDLLAWPFPGTEMDGFRIGCGFTGVTRVVGGGWEALSIRLCVGNPVRSQLVRGEPPDFSQRKGGPPGRGLVSVRGVRSVGSGFSPRDRLGDRGRHGTPVLILHDEFDALNPRPGEQFDGFCRGPAGRSHGVSCNLHGRTLRGVMTPFAANWSKGFPSSASHSHPPEDGRPSRPGG